MAPHTFLFALALTFAAASAGPMMLMASPEPPMDPMAGPALYLVSTGSSKMPMKVLERKNKVCPGDYPTGFTVLCHAGGPARKAIFYVNKKRYSTEYKEPYYIAGDYKGRVRPWSEYPKKAKILCKLGRRLYVKAKIKFVC